MPIDLFGKGERIKETILPVSEAEWLKAYWQDAPPRMTEYVWALYLRMPDGIVMLRHFFSDSVIEVPSGGFLAYLYRLQPGNLKELMYALDTYHPCIRMLESGSYPAVERLEGSLGRAIEEILTETHGVLLWHHQLEQIIGLFVRDHGEVINLRKGCNAKRPETLTRIQEMEVAKGKFLLDVIQERFGNPTSTCVTHDANLLYQALQS